MSEPNHLARALGIGAPDRAGRAFARLPDGREISHGDLERLSARYGACLRRMGVAPGDRVAVQVGKSVEALMLYLATIRTGAVFLPLNPAYTPAEVAYFLGNAEPALMVCDPSREDVIGPVAAEHGARLETMGAGEPGSEAGSFPGHIPADAPDFADTPRGPDDLAGILYTSGTTGRSKGAMLSHENLASNALTLAALWRFTPRDVLIHALPIFHTHGLFVATNVILCAGAALRLHPRFDAQAVLDDLAHATTLMGVPTFYTRLLDHPELTAERCAGMRVFISGSAPLRAETHAAWRARTGHAILERYGMTETGMITSNPYDGERRAGTVGMALPEVEVRVSDPGSGRALATGETGMIEVRGPNVFRGYWRMPDKTAEETREDGFFITGDLGRFDAEGYLSIVGRAKDLVISGGFNVYPKEIETVIDAVPGVLESAVIGLPHPDFGEGVAAVVVRADPALTEAAVIRACAEALARYKQPRRVLFAEALPRNSMGKVQKAELRERHAGLFTEARA